MTELACFFFPMQKGSFSGATIAMSEAEVLISSCFSFFNLFKRPDPERKTQSKKNPRNLRPILIPTESTNKMFKVLDAPELSPPYLLGNK